MARLRVYFRPYISLDWASEKMTELGLFRGNLKSDSRFICVSNLNSLHALVRVSDEDELRISRDLLLIPGVTKVQRA